MAEQRRKIVVDVPAMYPGDDYASGVVVELLPGRRCAVRLNDGRVVGACIPHFDRRHTYCPEPGHEVSVFLRESGGEFLLVGFPGLHQPRAAVAAEPDVAPARSEPNR